MKNFEKPVVENYAKGITYEPVILAESGCKDCCPFEKVAFDSINCPKSGCGRVFEFDANNQLIYSSCPRFHL